MEGCLSLVTEFPKFCLVFYCTSSIVETSTSSVNETSKRITITANTLDGAFTHHSFTVSPFDGGIAHADEFEELTQECLVPNSDGG